MLRQRLLSAFIIITCSLGFVALDAWFQPAGGRGLWMIVLAVFLMFGSAVECTRMIRRRLANFDRRPALIGCAGIMLATIVPILWPVCSGKPYPTDCMLGPLGWPLAAAMFVLVGCFVWLMPRYAHDAQVLERATLSGWIAVYFGITFAFWVAIRQHGVDTWGLTLVVGIIVVTKFTDAGAYFCGRAFGRTKLIPSVSPGKTVEGLFGGMAVGVVVSVIYFSVFTLWLYNASSVNHRWLGPILLGIVVTISGLIGDLLESVVKRETDVKDSSQLMPGLGGLWDVTDSLLPTGAVSYLLVAADLFNQPA